MTWYINFLAWTQRIISLVCFANNAIHLWPQVMQIFDREMPPRFTPVICLRRNFVYISNLENRGDKSLDQNFWNIVFNSHANFREKLFEGLDCTASKTKAKFDPQANFPRWWPPDLHADAEREAYQKICQFLTAETCSIFLNQVC